MNANRIKFEIGDTFEFIDEWHGRIYYTVSEMGQGEIYFECFEYGIVQHYEDTAARYVTEGVWKKVQF